MILVLAYLGGHRAQQAAEKADADRFAALQTDFKKLQTEFNKIDPGWEYSEGCSAPHFASGDGQPGCEVALYASKPGQINSDKSTEYTHMATMFIGKASDTESSSQKSLTRDGFTAAGKSYCAISLGSENAKAYVICSSEAQKFYFQRTDQ